MMRRLLIVAVVTALVAPLAVAEGKAAGQSETGTVPLAGPGPNGETTGGCWTGWARRAWIISGGATSGPFGSMIEIDKKTWNGTFELTVEGGLSGSEDLDVTFYADPGAVDPADPAMQAGIVETGAYLTRTAGGEDGTVPPTSTLALICLGIGTGANAEWSYEAKPPVKKKRK
jgi:hypothetical protein